MYKNNPRHVSINNIDKHFNTNIMHGLIFTINITIKNKYCLIFNKTQKLIKQKTNFKITRIFRNLLHGGFQQFCGT